MTVAWALVPTFLDMYTGCEIFFMVSTKTSNFREIVAARAAHPESSPETD